MTMTTRSTITGKLGARAALARAALARAALALGALVAAAALAAPAARAQAQQTQQTQSQNPNDALLNTLVRKGVLTQQDAADLRAEVAKQQDQQPAAVPVIAGSKTDSAFVFSGRIQAQYANLVTTDADDLSDNVNNRVGRAFLRRIYLGVKASLGANWSANINYDFADSGSFDKAFIEWAGNLGNAPFAFDIGLRKVNFDYDEFTSSANLKCIERSGASRYFAENADGRKLGAASYHIGLFADYNPNAFAGKTTGFFAGAALTNADRQSAISEVSVQSNAVSNQPAAWLNAGYSAKTDALSCIVGIAGAYLPRMGGLRASNGSMSPAGQNITEGDIYVDLTSGIFNIVAEYLVAKVDKGNLNATTATVSGFWIQPSVKLGKKWELVARYSYTSSDGRGVRVSDGVRSAFSLGNASVTAKALSDYYIGANYYIKGNDLKLQFGYVGGQTAGALLGAAALDKETVNGLRAQMQVNF